jgi:XrtJ-associated TM-motif-TM protein
MESLFYMKKIFLLTALATALLVSVPARAQGGCDDSPENPTLILAGLAGGAYAVSALRTRVRARKATRNQ